MQLDYLVCFTLTARDRDGTPLWAESFTNGITTAGLNHALETQFRGGSAVNPWKLGLIDGSSTPALAAADTMSSHAGWTEVTAYAEAARPDWSPAAASGGIV